MCTFIGCDDAPGEDLSHSRNAERARVAGWSRRLWQTVVDETGVEHRRFQVLSSPANQVRVASKMSQNYHPITGDFFA